MDNIKFYSNQVWLAEEQGDPDALSAKIVICDFSVNKNGVQLNRDTINEWVSSLVNAPLVGKIKAKGNGEIDFTSHNATVVTRVDENGEQYSDIEFNTDAFGTFTSAEIELVDGVECIVATAKVWKRFYDASNLIVKRIKEGTLSTSWEISVEDAEKKIISGSIVKVINRGRFIGHALLSSATAPAYDISRVLEVASANEDEELCSAILRDVMSMANDSTGNEVQSMEENINETVKTVVEEAPAVEETAETNETTEVVESETEQTEKAELTMWDLRKKVEDAICRKLYVRWLDMIWLFPVSAKAWAHKYDDDEMSLNEFTYTVANDEVEVSEPSLVTLTVAPREINSAFDEKNSALVEANKQINELSAQVEALAPYKAAAEKAELEAAEAKRNAEIAELREYAESAGVLSKEELESEEVAALINDLKALEIKALIADRIVEKSKNAKPIETSQKRTAKVRTEINYSEDTTNPVDALRNFIRRG